MLHEIGVELQAALAAAGCPYRVFDGPIRTTDANFRDRIVLEHDEQGADSFAMRHNTARNPRAFFARGMACKLTIYAASPKAGALEYEHRRQVEHVLDIVVVSLQEIAKGRQNLWTPKSGRFLKPDEWKTTDTLPGVAYEFKFDFDRGIVKRTWVGDAEPTTTIVEGEIQSKTEVSIAGDPANTDMTVVPSDAEVSCGGE